MTGRRDVAVVMARGRGRRMGTPKEGLRLPSDERTFLERVVEVHREAGREVMVIVRTGSRGSASAVSGLDGVRVVAEPDGGDTARTLLAAWRILAQESPLPTHVWAHPVDLPLVEGTTLMRLLAVSGEHENAIVRPVWNNRPGHPVVIPARLMAELALVDGELDGPMRDFLARGGWRQDDRRYVEIEVSDPGVAWDFDTPEQLSRTPKPKSEDDA